MADDPVVGLDDLDGLPSLDAGGVGSDDGLPSLDAGASESIELDSLPSLDAGVDSAGALGDDLANQMPDLEAPADLSVAPQANPAPEIPVVNPAASSAGGPAADDTIGGRAGPSGKVVNIKNIQSIKVRVQAILGGVNMSVSELADLKQNDLIPLDACIGDEVDLWANGVLIGKGEIVVIEAETPRFGITLTKLVNSDAANAAE